MSSGVGVMFGPLISAIGFIKAGKLFARAHLLLDAVADERQIKCHPKCPPIRQPSQITG
jgi:hypothetical protein